MNPKRRALIQALIHAGMDENQALLSGNQVDAAFFYGAGKAQIKNMATAIMTEESAVEEAIAGEPQHG